MKNMLFIVVSMSVMHMNAYKVVGEAMAPGAYEAGGFRASDTFIPFEGGRVDYTLVAPTDMMVMIESLNQGVQIHNYLFVQLEPSEKSAVKGTLRKLDQGAFVNDALIASVEKKSSITATVLKDFQKMAEYTGRAVTVKSVLDALQSKK